MNLEEVEQKAWESIDELVKELPQSDYLSFLENLIDDAKVRAEAVREEMGENDDE